MKKTLIRLSPKKIQRDEISPAEYKKQYEESIANPEKFWAEVADRELDWFVKWNRVFRWDFPYVEWFIGGKLNIVYNCLDRHIKAGLGGRVAYIYLNERRQKITITYQELLRQVNKFANGLKSLGVKKGDRVVIYMPLVIEQIVAMLACARIGAVHSVVFGALSSNALRQRTVDSEAKVIITADFIYRRGVKKELKPIVREATKGLSFVKHIIVWQREHGNHLITKSKEIDFDKLTEKQSDRCEPEMMDAEDPLFVLYTSGSTGTPKGIVHTTGGYGVYASFTMKTVFGLRQSDIFWCTADTGWITGHSYVVYGPLLAGATSVIVEGAPDYPTADYWWEIIEEQKVTIFYTSPTLIRMFRKLGGKSDKKYDLTSLRILGTVGEPISPEIWRWYHEHIGGKKCPIQDTWWQTETGGHMIVTLPSMKQKPGSAGKPFFGIEIDIVDKKGKSVPAGEKGFLVIKKPWPSALRNCLNDEKRYKKYWNEIKGVFSTGDYAIKDKDGYVTILGRSDDVINVSGHRIGSAEVESAILTHSAVSEAAVIGKPDEARGEKVKAFVVLKEKSERTEKLSQEIRSCVRREIAGYAMPAEIEFVDTLPKTRSGKIMRRVLKARELGNDAGDLSALSD
jgi:acetyl-CoA synthetase